MKYGKFYVDPVPVGDGSDDTYCRVFPGDPNAPGYDADAAETDNFTITQTEEQEYGSLDAAIHAYMRQHHPDNAPAHERCFRRIQRREHRLSNATERLLRDLLTRCGGRVSYHPQPDEDGCTDYPISMALYGRHDNPTINITDVYLDGNILRADGFDNNGDRNRGFELHPEHYSWTLEFVAIALGIPRQSVFSKPVSGIRSRIVRLLRVLKDKTIRFIEHVRLSMAYMRADQCTDYDTARKEIEKMGLSLAEYGDYRRDPQESYAYYTSDGRRDNPHGIFIIYSYRLVGPDSYVADKILSIEKR